MTTRFRFKLAPATVGMLILLFTACGQEQPSTPSIPKIIGGSSPASSSPALTSTVALVRENSEGTPRIFCTGTLIARNLVVTAAHCLEIFHNATEFKVLFGGSTDTSAAAVLSPISEFKTYKPEGSKYFPNFDLGWVKLTSDAPSAYTPIEIWHNPATLPAGKNHRGVEYLLAGFGMQASECHTADCVGTKLEVESQLREPVHNNTRLHGIMVFGTTPRRGTCNGDSGGPAYAKIHNKWYLVGATNGADAILTPAVFTVPSSQACEVGQTIHTFVGNYAKWIEQSSHTKLHFNKKINPREKSAAAPSRASLPKNPDFIAWYEYDNPNDGAWYTTQRIAAEVAIRHPAKTRLAAFQNPNKIYKALKKNRQLTLNGVVLAAEPSGYRDEQLTEVAPLATLPLTELNLTQHAVTNYSPLAELLTLQKLAITSNMRLPSAEPIPFDASFVSSLHNLIYLDLSGTKGIKIDEIDWKNLKKLKEVHLDDTGINNLDFVEQLPNLEILSLAGNKIESVTPLLKLKNLKKLAITADRIDDVNVLHTLTGVTIIDSSSLPRLGFKIPETQPVDAL